MRLVIARVRTKEGTNAPSGTRRRTTNDRRTGRP